MAKRGGGGGDKKLWIVGASVLTLLGVTWLYRRRAAAVEQETADDDVVDIPDVTKGRVAEFFNKINQHMVEHVAGLQQHLAQYQGQVPQEQLMQVMQQQFEEELTKYQNQLFTAWGVTEEEMNYAQIFYQQDEAVATGVRKLQMLHGQIMGIPPEGDLPDDLDEEKMLELLEATFKVPPRVLKRLQERYGTLEITPGSAAHTQFVTESEKETTAILEGAGLSEELFGAALLKFQNHPRVVETINRCQEEQQRQYMALGLD